MLWSQFMHINFTTPHWFWQVGFQAPPVEGRTDARVRKHDSTTQWLFWQVKERAGLALTSPSSPLLSS